METINIYFDKEGNIVESNILIKVSKIEYLEQLQKGKLYMKPLEYFRKLEKDGVGDEEEGIVGKYDRGELLHKGEKVGLVKDIKVYLENYPVFCLLFVTLKKVSETRHEFILPPKFLEEFMYEKDAKYGILVMGLEQLSKKIDEALKRENISGRFGKVDYTDDVSVINPNEAYKAAFRKRTKFKHQNEYRLLVEKPIDEDYYVLDIGDISDFSCILEIPSSEEEIKMHIDFSEKKIEGGENRNA